MKTTYSEGNSRKLREILPSPKRVKNKEEAAAIRSFLHSKSSKLSDKKLAKIQKDVQDYGWKFAIQRNSRKKIDFNFTKREKDKIARTLEQERKKDTKGLRFIDEKNKKVKTLLLKEELEIIRQKNGVEEISKHLKSRRPMEYGGYVDEEQRLRLWRQNKGKILHYLRSSGQFRKLNARALPEWLQGRKILVKNDKTGKEECVSAQLFLSLSRYKTTRERVLNESELAIAIYFYMYTKNMSFTEALKRTEQNRRESEKRPGKMRYEEDLKLCNKENVVDLTLTNISAKNAELGEAYDAIDDFARTEEEKNHGKK